MNIVGIDPGTARVGWAILSVQKGVVAPIAFGCIETPKTQVPPERLLSIYTQVGKLLGSYQPDCLALEDLFFATNAKTIIPVGQARGVILLAAAQQRLAVISYSPLTVKQTICGYGKAEKRQVQLMVTRILHLKQVPKPDDTADALAIALTHAYSYKLKQHL